MGQNTNFVLQIQFNPLLRKVKTLKLKLKLK